jgi:AAA+ lid domain
MSLTCGWGGWQGICRMTKEQYREPLKVARLWVHEVERVFRDRMVTEIDMAKFNEFRVNVTKKYFEDLNQVGGALASFPTRVSYIIVSYFNLKRPTLPEAT